MPNSLNEHVHITEDEWTNLDYFKNIKNFLKERKIEKVLDVGGCTGQVSAVLLHEIPTIKKITILEPVIENYNFIVERAKHADTANIEVINKALFYGDSKIQLGQCDDNVGGWSFQHKNNQTDFVNTITLEDLEMFDFVKIDIEGAERVVIPNSTSIHEIPYLEIEFHDDLYMPDKWKKYAKENLKNHKLKFEGTPRPNAFFVRKDLY